jgi:hypothetical protein
MGLLESRPAFVVVIVALEMQIKYQVAQIRKLVVIMLNLMQLPTLPDVGSLLRDARFM